MSKSFAEHAANMSWDTKELEPLEDGEYKGLLHKAELKQSKESSRWMLAIQVKVVEGDNAGQIFFGNLMFENKNGWNPYMVKNFFKQCDLELPEFEDMEETIEELVENQFCFDFELSTKNDFQTITVLEVDDDYEAEDSDEDGDEEDDSEVPTEEEINGMKKKELLALIEEQELDYDGKETPKAMKEFLIEELHGEDEDEDEDDSEDEDGEEEESGNDDPIAQALFEFCEESGISEVEEDMDLDAMKEAITEEGYEFDFDDLEEEEVKTLTDAGLKSIIDGLPKKKKASGKSKKKSVKKKK